MKKYNLLKHILSILLVALVIVLCLYMRYLAMEQPNWVDTALIYPLLVLRIIADGTWLMDLHLALATAFAVMLVPCQGNLKNWRRFLIRPLIGVAVFMLLRVPSWGMINQISDTVWFSKYADNYQQVQEMIDDSEHMLVSGGGHTTEPFAKHLPALSYKGEGTYNDGRSVYYARNAILVDIDAPSLTFCDYGSRYDRGYTTIRIPLEPAAKAPNYANYRLEFSEDLTYIFTYYYTGERYAPVDQNTLICITLQMPDGSLWISSDLTDPTTGKVYDFDFYRGREYILAPK